MRAGRPKPGAQVQIVNVSDYVTVTHLKGTRMRHFLIFVLLGTPAFAHPGHLAEVAGHGHWLGAAAIGAAIAIGLYAGLNGRKSRAEKASEEEAADQETRDPQEA